MAYSNEQIESLFNTILKRVENGESLRAILRDDNMSSRQTFYDWLKEDSQKVDQYARATESRADHVFDEMLEIADDGTNDFTTKIVQGEPVEVLNSEHVQRSRLRIDTRKWILSKMNPKKYGDKLELENNINVKDKINLNINFKDFS